jgi:hypothetical protein
MTFPVAIILCLFCLYAVNNCGSPNPAQEKKQTTAPGFPSDTLSEYDREERQEIEKNLKEMEKEDEALEDTSESFNPEEEPEIPGSSAAPISFAREVPEKVTLLWKFQTQGKVCSTPLIKHELLFFESRDKNFYALDKKTRKQIWKFETTGAAGSNPAIGENLVFI